MRNVFKAFANLLVLLLLVILPKSLLAFQSTETNTPAPDSLSQTFGFIYFDVEPDTAFVYLNYDYENAIKVTDGDSLKLIAENHNLLIFAKDIPERRINLEVAESEVDTVSLKIPRAESVDDTYATYAAYRWNANVMLFSDNETLISIDDSDHFAYGSLRANLPPGVYRVRFESLSGKEHDVFLEVNSYQLETYEKYFKPKEPTARIAGVIPGVSQFYKKQPLKGISAIALLGLTTGLTLHYNSKLAAGKEDFYNIRRRYDQAVTEQVALNLGNQLDEVGSEVTGYKNRRNMFRIAAILVYAANFVDAFREPENGFAKQSTFNPYRDFSVDINSGFVEARVQLNF